MRREASGRVVRCWLASLVIAASGVFAHATDVAPEGTYKEVARSLEPWLAAEVEAKGLPALSIALVDDQRIVWSRGFGFADPAKHTPATAETAYRVGSVSKLFTDLAAMQLVEAGRLDLDAPVSVALPEFAPKNPFDVAITLRHLMAHRSGLNREPPVGHYFDPSPPAIGKVIASLNTNTLVYKPGTRTKYSNAGVTVVGAAIEKLRAEPFAVSIRKTVLDPLGMAHTSFEPGAELSAAMAKGVMWSYDGQAIKTPTFLLGTGPAGNLVSTVSDLGRFLSALFAEGAGVVKPETLREMFTPQFDETAGFGLGFTTTMLEGERRVGHGGAVYGCATELAALPDAKLGVVVIASRDCANGVARNVADAALRLMLAARKGKPFPALESSQPVPPERIKRLEGRYAHDAKAFDVYGRDGRLYLNPFTGGQRVELRVFGDGLVVDDCLAHGPSIVAEGDTLLLGRDVYAKTEAGKPDPSPERWAGLIGEYGWDHDVLYILEKHGKLYALIEWFFEYPLTEDGPDRFKFPDWGLYDGESLVFTRDASGNATQVKAASVNFHRRKLDGEDGKTFRITPTRPVEVLRAENRSAKPPVETGPFRKPKLVDLTTLDPGIKLDIRYATTNNFLGTPFYTSARAFLQRPAAGALAKAHRALAEQGYGLLIHDAYRPWQVTKLFWEATPETGRGFVADPSKGSKHNRGSAVDLTLYDLTTGEPVRMVGGYDEFSPRSYPDYQGGTALQRWHRERLRRAMEAEGFTVNEVEWWHFDHRDWAKYPILDRRFEELP